MRQYVARPGQECKSELIVGAEVLRATLPSQEYAAKEREVEHREKSRAQQLSRVLNLAEMLTVPPRPTSWS